MEKLRTVLLLSLVMGSILMPMFASKTLAADEAVIAKSNWTKLTNHLQGADDPDWSPSGEEITYVTWDESQYGTLYRMNADGSNHATLHLSGIGQPDISHDGSRIAFKSFDKIYVSNYDGTGSHMIYANGYLARWSSNDAKLAVVEVNPYCIVTIDPDGTNRVPLTDNANNYQYPSWSPDGTRITYNRNNDIWLMDSNGGNQHSLTGFGSAFCPVWSADGSSIYFFQQTGSTWSSRHIFRMSVDGTNIVQLTNSTGEWDPSISSDGKWIAFAAYDESGVRNVYKTQLSMPPPASEAWIIWAIGALVIIACLLPVSMVYYRRKSSHSKQVNRALGKPASKEYTVCPNCGESLPAGSKFCGKCGTSLNRE